jgi:D-serine deaminase-like pyridoxal phosphate-dependent protein
MDPAVAPPLPAGIDTPAIVIDLGVVERNARRLAGALAERGIVDARGRSG